MHNLGTVVKFEILKQVRKPLFWLALFAFPALIVLISGISYIGSEMGINQTKVAEQNVFKDIKSIIIVDETGLINPSQLAGADFNFAPSLKSALIALKASTNNQALIYYPKDIPKSPIKTYTKTTPSDSQATQQVSMGIQALASTILNGSIQTTVSSQISAILSSPVATDATIIDQQGEAYNPLQRMIVPGLFLVVYFIIITLTGNQILVSTTEEKENRVAEMILTTVDGKTLISGKIIALVALGFIQIIALIIPVVLFYLLGQRFLNLPPEIGAMFTGLTFDFWPICFGLTLLILGYLLTTGSTILVGSLFPTAQDAAQFYAPIILSSMIPIYFAAAIFNGVQSPVVNFLSYFPLSAPMTLLMRNTAGNLSVSQGLIGLAVLFLSSILMMLLAVRAFRFGAFEYSKTGSIQKLLNRKS